MNASLTGEGATPGHSLSGSIYTDLDLSGTKGASETGFAGKRVLLFDGNFDFVDETFTGTDGGFGFAGLAAGSYLVDVQALVTSPNANPLSVTVSSGDISGLEIGISDYTIMGVVRYGSSFPCPEGEPAAGISIDFYLFDDPGSEYIRSVVTDENGVYKIGVIPTPNGLAGYRLFPAPSDRYTNLAGFEPFVLTKAQPTAIRDYCINPTN